MKLLLPIILLVFTGQAQVNHCKDSTVNATVYFYRVSEHIGLAKRHTKLKVDGAKTLQMSEGSYAGFYLTPGAHELTMDAERRIYCSTLKLARFISFEYLTRSLMG